MSKSYEDGMPEFLRTLRQWFPRIKWPMQGSPSHSLLVARWTEALVGVSSHQAYVAASAVASRIPPVTDMGECLALLLNELNGVPGNAQAPPRWAVLEQFGMRLSGGLVSECQLFGCTMGRIDVPSGNDWVTTYFHGSSVYALTHVDESTAREVNVVPTRWDRIRRKLSNPIVPRPAPEFADHGDGSAEVEIGGDLADVVVIDDGEADIALRTAIRFNPPADEPAPRDEIEQLGEGMAGRIFLDGGIS